MMVGGWWLLASYRGCPDGATAGRGDVGDPEDTETTKWVIRQLDRDCCGNDLVYQNGGVAALVAVLNDGQLRKRSTRWTDKEHKCNIRATVILVFESHVEKIEEHLQT